MSFNYFLVLLAVFCAIHAQEDWNSGGPAPDPANPDNCLFLETPNPHSNESDNSPESNEFEPGISIAKGESVNLPNHCSKIICNEDLSWQGVGCPDVEKTDTACKTIAEDLNKDFPECCEKVECP